MNHRQLEVFRAVIWANGITAAAKALNVSQPAVSRTIADLEYSVGFKLFRRVGNRATPTDEARLFLEEVDRSFVGLEALRDAAYEIRTLVRGSVRVSSSVTSSLSTLPGATRKFLAQHPGIQLSVSYDHSPRVAEHTSSRQADVGLIAREANYAGVALVHQYMFNYVWVVPVDHALADKDCIRPEDLENSKVILPERDYLRQYGTGMSLLRALNPATIINNAYVFSACAFAAEGIGVALVDPLNASHFSASGKVVVRPVSMSIPIFVSQIRPESKQLSQAAQQLSKHIDEEIRLVFSKLGPEVLQSQPKQSAGLAELPVEPV